MSRVSIREQQRIKQRQMMNHRLIIIGVIAVFAVLLGIFLVRGVILPLMSKTGSNSGGDTLEADGGVTYEVDAGDAQAIRIPVKSDNDTAKAAVLTPGWHENSFGKWYQNPDGTFFADGFQEIEGVQYSFDSDGYIQTGWVYSGANEYYFDEDGAYNPDKKRPMLALTFDDGPSKYTMDLLNCLEENNAHATFFMLGELVGSYPDEVRKMVEIGCELGNHSYDHSDQTTLSLDQVYKQFNDTDNLLIEACGQAATVARAPYGNGNQDIYDTVGKPFIFWSLDSLDWKLLDVDADYDSVMNGDLTDGTIILMHDIHEPSVRAAIRFIPELIEKGYRLVTVSEMAAAKNVSLQNALYIDFWQSTLDSGSVAGYNGEATLGSTPSSGGADAVLESSDEDVLESGSSDGEGADDEYYEEDAASGDSYDEGDTSEEYYEDDSEELYSEDEY